MSTLSWELHGTGSEIAFVAVAGDHGYAVTVSRDGMTLLHEMAPDGSALLRRSLELRESFRQLGYVPIPLEQDAALRGGPCWGPGAPLSASVIASSTAPDFDFDDVVELGTFYELPMPLAFHGSQAAA